MTFNAPVSLLSFLITFRLTQRSRSCCQLHGLSLIHFWSKSKPNLLQDPSCRPSLYKVHGTQRGEEQRVEMRRLTVSGLLWAQLARSEETEKASLVLCWFLISFLTWRRMWEKRWHCVCVCWQASHCTDSKWQSVSFGWPQRPGHKFLCPLHVWFSQSTSRFSCHSGPMWSDGRVALVS